MKVPVWVQAFTSKVIHLPCKVLRDMGTAQVLPEGSLLAQVPVAATS
ncbi:MAG: hypothetical protein ACP5CD_04040 [Thermovirgaceae bacterium]